MPGAPGKRKISKDEYKRRSAALRVELLNAQFDLRRADFPVIVVIGGEDRLAANETVDLLNEWMDGRYIDTRYFGAPSDEERQRPRFWRYWRVLPPRGKIALCLGEWSINAVADRADRRISKAAFERRVRLIRRFEGALADDGALVLKFWMHLPKREFNRRLRQARKHPDEAWRIDELERLTHKEYDRLAPVGRALIQGTDTPQAPWLVIEAGDVRERNLTVAQTILDALTQRLQGNRPGASRTGSELDPVVEDALSAVDLTSTIGRETYKRRLDKLQEGIRRLSVEARRAGLSSVLVFEGWDAAGKGGVIRRITRAMDARDYKVVPIAAPTEEERARHYLWRFWRHLPRAGHAVIFDRSWYGRVLVERVEGLARPDEWQRAYAEINDFEEQLVHHGMLVRKFWLHIDPDEQLARFRVRETTPYKKYKITDEDYRNRGKWEAYVVAVNEMVARTGTAAAPWHLVPANDKRFARIEVLRLLHDALRGALERRDATPH